MCEANVYVIPAGGEEETLFLEAVDSIIPEGPDLWRLTSIFGERKTLAARLKSLALVEHRVIFELPGGRP